MKRPFIQIIADDLTGALDAAAPFATPRRPMRLLAGNDSVDDPSDLAGLTVSSGSRDLDTRAGDAALQEAFESLAGSGVPDASSILRFAKVDSVLRGRPVAETLFRMRLWHAETCLFAPAFPKMGRRTIEGRHEIRVNGGWQAAQVHDLVEAFRSAGIETRLRGVVETKLEPGPGVIIGDASDACHLATHVTALEKRSDMIWAGSRGLAEAIAGTSDSLPVPSLGSVIIGTNHSSTRRQLRVAQESGVLDEIRLIDPVPNANNAAVTFARVADDVTELDVRPESGLLVVGGETLGAVLSATGTQTLDCVGEVAPGVPLSRFNGGRFDDRLLITKSGGFGEPDLLKQILS